jgi:1,4-alpha-glucan branching enzyme
LSGERGELALVLHTHMPYVEGFGTWPFGEEWLWEAVAGVYLPLLDVLGEAPVTIGLTPVLCDQLELLSGEAGERLVRFMAGTRLPIHAQDAAGCDAGGEPELAAELRRAAGDYGSVATSLDALGGDVVGAFRALATDGPAELWTSSATHAVLPLLGSDAGIRLQVRTALASHERRFGRPPAGFWLPECAYEPGLERFLEERGASVFCVDQTLRLGLGSLDHLQPVAASAGATAVPLDWDTIRLVWDDRSGYPVHPLYRDYHRRTVHDLRPWSNSGEPYRRDDALALAREHARDFVARTIARLDRHGAERGRPGLVCCALDPELLGHWWYEGPEWLRGVLEESRTQGLALSPLGEAVARREPVERQLAASSWGRGKDLSTWDSPMVAELAFAARSAELRTVAAAAGTADSRALARAARELMALQSSDWAFMVTRDLASDYPQRRVEAHAAAHDAALTALTDSGSVPDPSLRNLAPGLDLSPLTAA